MTDKYEGLHFIFTKHISQDQELQEQSQDQDLPPCLKPSAIELRGLEPCWAVGKNSSLRYIYRS